MGNFNEGYVLHRNVDTNDHNWLNIRLVGSNGINRDAVGSRVYLTDSNGMTQMQEVISGSSLGAGSDLALHFGLGNAEVQTIRIVWSNGQEQIINSLQPNQHISISYGK